MNYYYYQRVRWQQLDVLFGGLCTKPSKISTEKQERIFLFHVLLHVKGVTGC